MTNETVPKAVQKLIDAVRKPFAQYAEQYRKLAVTRAELAPRFMKAFNAWAAETSGNFIEFVRLFDPTVPHDRAGYRAHSTFMAADYLRRISTNRRDVGANRAKPVRSNVTAMARLMATLLPLVKDQESVWKEIVAELGLTNRQSTRLRAIVAQVDPIFDVSGVKPIGTAKIIHMKPAEAEAAHQGADKATPVKAQRGKARRAA